jgi:hypothetical protein
VATGGELAEAFSKKIFKNGGYGYSILKRSIKSGNLLKGISFLTAMLCDPLTVLCVATGGEIAKPFLTKSSKMEVMDIVFFSKEADMGNFTRGLYSYIKRPSPEALQYVVLKLAG